MSKFIITGGKPLRGEVKVSGNKNSILPIMAATVLTREKCELSNVPQVKDVEVMGEILKDIGAEIKGLGSSNLTIDPSGVDKSYLNPDLVKKLRAAILLLGPLLARFGKAKMKHPGGCLIGRRAVGTHFDALEALGAKTITGEEEYESVIQKLAPATIFLDEASVTATENAMMMASLIPGTTVIEDAACEPHIEDLGNFLNSMGAKIDGAGTNRIVISGAKSLRGTVHQILPDYIDIGTFAVAAATTGGTITINGVRAKDLRMILLYLERMGVDYRLSETSLEIFRSNLHSPKAKIQTRPWPGFPTDLMSPLIVLATQAKGATLCHDWMYESRMFFVDKLITMGANITLCDPHRVLVVGPTELSGKELESPDIRAGMALIIAALKAEGQSTIDRIELIERGYEDIEGRLRSLGAEIKKVE
jgi:UDP-N-acetylglucosamine 1-carboxyvinyltransferase